MAATGDPKKQTKCGVINFDTRTYCDLVRGHKGEHTQVPLDSITKASQ